MGEAMDMQAARASYETHAPGGDETGLALLAQKYSPDWVLFKCLTNAHFSPDTAPRMDNRK